MKASSTSPVAFPVNVQRLPQKGMPVTIVADDEQRKALADAHGLVSVDGFRSDLTIRPWKKDGVRVSGTVKADIVQTCVVTLDPLEAHIEEEISAIFVPEGSSLARDPIEGGEMVLDAEGPDSPETFRGETIDVGGLAEEFFELAIDPYPRKADATVEAELPEPETVASGPLYVKLKKLYPQR
ncbi:MAG TPA: DUF177 domain-containing protein [Rhizobiaceae bacterium]|nr:DUF177 domain-containing protein [Rhizobiaceae bacterium]